MNRGFSEGKIVNIPVTDKSLVKTNAYINGQWVDSDSGDTLAVTNPATGEVIAHVASCGTAETRRAIEAAQLAQIEWRQRSIKERSAILRRWFNLMMESQEDLAQILTAEQGKPLAEARGRDRIRGKLYRVVCRGRQAHLWRYDPSFDK